MSVVVGNCGNCWYWNRMHATIGECGRIAGAQSLTLLENLTADAVIRSVDIDPRLVTRSWFGCTAWQATEQRVVEAEHGGPMGDNPQHE